MNSFNLRSCLGLICLLLTNSLRAHGSVNEALIEPERELARLVETLPLSVGFPSGSLLVYILDPEFGNDVKHPHRSLKHRMKYALGLVGRRIEFMSGGARLAVEAKTRESFFAKQDIVVTTLTNLVAGSTGMVSRIEYATNAILRPLDPSTALPDLSITCELVDETEAPVETKSKEVSLDALIGPFSSAFSIDGGLRFFRSKSRATVSVTITQFGTEIQVAKGSVNIELTRREKGRDFGLRYGWKAGFTYGADESRSDSVEEALTAACIRALTRALANLAGLPASRFSAFAFPSPEERQAVENRWINADVGARRRCLLVARALAERERFGAVWPNPDSSLSAPLYRELMEKLPLPKFDPAPQISGDKAALRVVFEAFPQGRWEALQPEILGLMQRGPSVKSVWADTNAPEIGFFLRGDLGQPHLIREHLATGVRALTGIDVDSELLPDRRTIYVRYRPTLTLYNP